MAQVDWTVLYNNQDTNSAFEVFHNKVTEIYNVAFPKVKIKSMYYVRKPWLTYGLKKSIKIKNKLYAIMSRKKTVYNETIYKNYRNRLHKLLKNAERNYYNDQILTNRNNIRKTWSIIKTIINKNKGDQIKQTKFMLSDGSVTDDKEAVAEKYNDFFVNVGPNLAKKIPEKKQNPLNFLKNVISNSIYLTPVTPSEVVNIMGSCKDSSPGFDDIKISPLRCALQHIADPLSYICNLSLTLGVFPDKLKIANVIPLFKKDNQMCFNNYRPVSLLCTFSKIFEKVMYVRLLDFLNQHRILFEYQFGFRKNHSTQLALTVLMDKLIKSMDNGDHVIGVFLDFSKAFDTVDHLILLNKLHHYGIRGSALDWFRSYLSNHQQFVTYNYVSSDTKTIKCGVPQGSILGPLLFLIYINDLANICQYTMPILFADDSNLFTNGTDVRKIELELNEELRNIASWLKINKLSLNVNKTQYMVFTRKLNKIEDIVLKVEGKTIERVTQTKFLGVIIDEKLTWRNHVNYIATKIAKGIGILIKARFYLSKETLVSLYYTFIYPYLTYCNSVWGDSFLYNLNRLHVLQKKVVRIISHANWKAHTEPLFKELEILPIKDINIYIIAQFMFRFNNGLLPEIFDNFFTTNDKIHSYDTRSKKHLHPPVLKSELGRKGIRRRGMFIWNQIISLDIQLDTSQPVFKQICKRLIRQRLILDE